MTKARKGRGMQSYHKEWVSIGIQSAIGNSAAVIMNTIGPRLSKLFKTTVLKLLGLTATRK